MTPTCANAISKQVVKKSLGKVRTFVVKLRKVVTI